VLASGGLVTLPARIARSFGPGFGLVSARPPLSLRPFDVPACWHRHNDQDPRLCWMVKRARPTEAP